LILQALEKQGQTKQGYKQHEWILLHPDHHHGIGTQAARSARAEL